jgi:hypothetical protein
MRYGSGGQSKVIAVSGKDRGAILLAGKRGTAYMYMGKTGRFASSTYYMQTHPEWHTRFYADRPQDKWFTQTWTLSHPEAAYARSSSEASPWFRNFSGMGQSFPFKPAGVQHPTRRTTKHLCERHSATRRHWSSRAPRWKASS